MGYNPDLADSQAQTDKIAYEEIKKQGETNQVFKGNAHKSQTKEEQEELLEKVKSYGFRGEQPSITASNVDFSKSLDHQDNNEEAKGADKIEEEAL